MTTADTYMRLIAFLDEHGAQYRLIDHAPEGRTELVSPLRGNALAQAAKCIVIMVKIGKKTTKYVLRGRPRQCMGGPECRQGADEEHLRALCLAGDRRKARG